MLCSYQGCLLLINLLMYKLLGVVIVSRISRQQIFKRRHNYSIRLSKTVVDYELSLY